MGMNDLVYIIFVIAIATFISRIAPFVFFRNDVIPGWIEYLGNMLPFTVMGLLIVYSIKGTELNNLNNVLPVATGIFITGFLQAKKGNIIISITSGTVIYMLLIQFIF